MDPAYRRSRFRLTPPAAGVPDTFAVMTAWNPDGDGVSAERNAERTRRFSEELVDRCLEHFPVTGFDPESGHSEPGFGIVCTKLEAIELGRHWDQEAIFWICDGELTLVSCTGDQDELSLGSWVSRIDDSAQRGRRSTSDVSLKMDEQPPPKNLEEVVDRFDDAAECGDRVSLDLMMDELGRRSFGPLLLFAGLIMAAPVVGDIPGVPPILGVFVILIAGQLLVGRDHFWLPQWLLKRSVPSKKLKKTADKWLRRPARAIDRVLQKRLQFFTNDPGAKAIAVASVLLALATPVAEFIPFSANGIGLAIATFGLALIAHDGLIALLGWIVMAATVVLATWAAI